MIVPNSIYAIFVILTLVLPGWSYKQSRKKWKSTYFETKYDEWITIFSYSFLFSSLSYLIIYFADAKTNQTIYNLITYSNNQVKLQGTYISIVKFLAFSYLLSYLFANMVCFLKMPAFVNQPTTQLFFDNSNLDLYEGYPFFAKHLAKLCKKEPKAGDYSISIIRMNNGDTLIGITVLYSEENKFAEKDLMLAPIPEKLLIKLPIEYQELDSRFWQRMYIPLASISSIKNVYLDSDIANDLSQTTNEVEIFRAKLTSNDEKVKYS